jgi:hypothetical protein
MQAMPNLTAEPCRVAVLWPNFADGFLKNGFEKSIYVETITRGV